ncbi:Asp-tRNA(Asn)/Glu-tRNA(Gln) amidotransferase subunit GatB [Haliea sp.]|uniref:Asp-tRNA(Asn)/Glu-tRNA(Gln) amidotransferase subunit GatB n=1 Tax=Haliea sp. TaxID=1932666 RepID=UPI003526D1C7
MNWEVVIGLEVHLQLATESKIFSGAATRFGAEPNTQACAVDLAMPGMLPVLNEQAVRYAVMFGLGIGAEIGLRSVFDRKNYFYPDLPKGYQISQFQEPIVGRGHFDIQLEDGSVRRIGITRAHLEEDAGKSLHEDFHNQTGIDLNRAGTPLLEIVSEPDLRSAEEAVAYLKTLHSLVTSLGISDGNMAEGSMRCDINLSLRPAGSETLGTRAEIKNVNSFRFVEKAIHHEIERQADILEAGGQVVQETRLYDAERDETRSMRSKEVANDYRYFPEPDLLPVVIEQSWVDSIRASLPELPAAKRERFIADYGLSAYDATVLAAERPLADFYEAVVKHCGDAKIAANWVQVELLGQLNRSDLTLNESPVDAQALAALLQRILDGSISGKIGKQVFEAMWAGEGDADSIIEARGLRQVSDSGALEAMVSEVIRANPEQVAQYLAADENRRKKLSGFFVGQIMKLSKGQANPQMVNDLLNQQLADAGGHGDT